MRRIFVFFVAIAAVSIGLRANSSFAELHILNGAYKNLELEKVEHPTAGATIKLLSTPKNGLYELNHCSDDTAEYYLSSGAVGDTFAVWYRPTRACSLYYVDVQWYDAGTVDMYVWEAGPDCPNDGIAIFPRDSIKLLGDVIAGPIPWTVTGGGPPYGWERLNLADYGPIPVISPARPFFIGFVKTGDYPHPLANLENNGDTTYTWFGGPTVDGMWGAYDPTIELLMCGWVAYHPWPGFAPAVNYPVDSLPYYMVSSDLDGDGDMDLAVTNYSSGNVSVLLNQGDGTFAPVVNYPVGGGPWFIVSSDLDGDGDTDLVVTNVEAQSISVLMNNGDGTFVPPLSYGVGDSPEHIVLSDLDGDGDEDMAVANAGDDWISVLLNNGNGIFTSAMNYDTEGGSVFIVSGDLDGDGDMDLAVPVGYHISVFLNHGDGTFAAPINNEVRGWASDMVYTDLDGDGDMDLAVPANTDSAYVSVLLNHGDGTFAPAVSYRVGDGPFHIVSSDLDGDGDTDLAVTNDLSDNVSVLLNNGDGTFTPAANYPVGSYPWFIVSSDLDGDGDMDLAVTNSNSDNVSVLINLTNQPGGRGTIAGTVENLDTHNPIAGALVEALQGATVMGSDLTDTTGSYSISDLPAGLYNLRASATGYRDTTIYGVQVISGEITSVNIELRLLGLFAPAVSCPVDSNPVFALAEDLDNDGDKDFAVANFNSDSISIIINNGDGTFAPSTNYRVSSRAQFIVAADFNGDRYQDLAVICFGHRAILVLLNNGDGTFRLRGYYVVPGPPFFLVADDFDGDGDFDLASANDWAEDSVSVLLNYGNGYFAPAVNYYAGRFPYFIISEYLDDDGYKDLAITNIASGDTGKVSVFLNQGNGTFALTASYNVQGSPKQVVVSDLNGDGHFDLSTNTGSVLLNNGDGTFAPAVNYTFGGDCIVSGDLDGDGDFDLAAAYSGDNKVSVAFNNGDGSFGLPTDYPVGDKPRFIVSEDLDGDGDFDLAVTSSDSNYISVLLNNGNGIFDTIVKYSVGRNPDFMICSDFDNDLDFDLASTNGGTNDISVLRNLSKRPVQRGTIAGRTRDLNTHELIRNVLVKALQDSTIIGVDATDTTGSYSIPDLPASLYNLRASATGYRDTTIYGVQVITDETTFVDIQLAPLLLPDLTISPQDISSDPELPVDSTVFTVNVKVHNVGAVDVDSAYVRFYYTYRRIVGPIPAGGSATASIELFIHNEEENFFDMPVEVDPDNLIPELNEGNNTAHKLLYFYHPRNIHFTCEPMADSVSLGGHLEFTIEVTNGNPGGDDFTLSVDSLQPSWYSLSADSFHLVS